mmetsp:Transcript_13017/g.36642  ORF Transcript_13017/g.36642 Transcript_13017/m.36642 type:complete len:484 (-) Transcript_13017:297-1748(-)
MDLFEAFGLLDPEGISGVDYNNYTTQDVEKCFRQQARKHHPDKGGDASRFRDLHSAKCILTEHIAKNGGEFSSYGTRRNETNPTAVSASLFEHKKHRTCIRQVSVLLGNKKAVIAATDAGLVVTTLKGDAMLHGSSDLAGISSSTTHREDSCFLCCTACPLGTRTRSADIVYAGSKDGFVHRIDLSAQQILTSWQHPSRQSVLSISAFQNWVAIATANGGIYVLQYENEVDRPTIAWKAPNDSGTTTRGAQVSSRKVSPETILLREGSVPNYLNLWVGGTNDDNRTGKLLMWELDVEEDFFEWYDEDDLFCLYHSALDDSEDLTSEASSNDDDSDGVKTAIPVINATVDEGPVYHLATHDGIVAATCGQSIVVWDWNNARETAHRLAARIKTIQTNNSTLYTVCINARFVAAAGSGESIMVWDRESWSLVHYLPLQKEHPSSCCLATNCIMTLDWFHEDSGILVSGGYDGVVTLWTMANRLEE